MRARRPARIVYVFCDRIREASVKYWQEYTEVLGLVVAHELGHVLLPAHRHSNRGVMNGRTNLWGKTAFDFIPEEAALIKSTLAREAQAENE
jgi:hypothetical protein